MKEVQFVKFQGTGNDFVMVDNRSNTVDQNDTSLVKKVCDRKFGVGSDGMIFIQDHSSLDFEMVFYNPDGTQSLCGNGSRCAVMFARHLGIIKDRAIFLTIDGPLEATIENDLVHLKMPDVSGVSHHADDLFINTGSPHFIKFVNDIESVNVPKSGKDIRNRAEFAPDGTNVNFVQKIEEDTIYVRTYERGVENETLSCGTGVTAAALASGMNANEGNIDIITKGGNLKVTYKKEIGGGFSEIYLIGPAEKVFTGKIMI